ncbi:hypothetical protein J5N97_019474 [Dioscorea zingiberensis]|uniref:Uncharacterized protein n=1 Tax=Dioscorea zingiberensis TaxID=325984 RepID=A0A9D5CG15_9LILI|nr:hypothetical protein J5N97_019474 [Dioscorea zingiberensis]
MDFELRAAREKLEREQRERKAKAKAKLEKERKAKAEAAHQRDAIEAAQRTKRIVAANALHEAEHQMEENLLIGKGVVFSRILEASCCDGYGDKIKLPPSCFSELSEQGALDKGPMYFRLSKLDEHASSGSDISGHTPGRTYSGVLEFTATEGSVELPPHVWSNLFSGDSPDVPLVDVSYVSLPKGTYAKLQPEDMGFFDIPNHKAVLETTLRRHATLSQGDIFTVNHGELVYKLRVLDLEPASSVSVLETDIQVDIEGTYSDSNGNKNQYALIPLVLGKSESGTVEEGKFNYYKFLIEDNTREKIASWTANLEVRIEVDSCDGDTNVYVSRHPLVFPTPHLHEWSSHEMGSKTLILNQKGSNIVAGTYSIGVFGFKGLTKYNICVMITSNNVHRVGEQANTSSQLESDSTECRNCRRLISNRTILLHEAYCIRHNVLCQHDGCGVVLKKEEAENHVHCTKCGRGLLQGEMEKHMKVFHEPIHCSCGIMLEKEDMVQHQTSVCPLRLITCRFCGDMVQAGSLAVDARDRLRGLSEHESICGSRTAPCDSCGRSVMLKEMDIHVIAVHQKS